MKVLVSLLILQFAFFSEAGRVRGYVKRNGTYVAPHARSKADKSVYNNYKYRSGDETRVRGSRKRGW